MSDPISPNFKKGVGRLVTDRYDFETHTNGTSFRHHADQVDLAPHITISSVAQTNVQDAIHAISLIAFPPTLPDATSSVKGLIKLDGDLGGTADLPRVVGLHTFPVTSATPTTGDVLTFDGSSWAPAAPVNNFTAGGDLGGTNSVQTVKTITGDTGIAAILCPTLTFASNVAPLITQVNEPFFGPGGIHPITIQAMGSSRSTRVGGSVLIRSGNGTVPGGWVTLGSSSDILVGAGATPLIGHRAVSLVKGGLTTLSSSDFSGDLVVYVGDAAINPTASPVGGTILYSSGGKLNIKQGDGVDFQIGSLPNPSIWGTTNEFVKTYRVSGRKIANDETPLIYNFALPQNSLSKIDVIVIGREESNTATPAIYTSNMSATIYWNGTSQIIDSILGVVINNEVIHEDFMPPNITVAGDIVSVESAHVGSSGFNATNLLMIIQVSTVVDS